MYLVASVNAAGSIKINSIATNRTPIFQLSSQQRRIYSNLAVAKYRTLISADSFVKRQKLNHTEGPTIWRPMSACNQIEDDSRSAQI